jgi:hypothetical protein
MMDEIEQALHSLSQFPSSQRLELLSEAAQATGLEDLMLAIELFWAIENIIEWKKRNDL